MSRQNGSRDVVVPAILVWTVFDALPENIRRIIREAGINQDPIEVLHRIDQLRAIGKSDEEIESWLTDALKALTHQKYLKAGHPQFS